jgi:hypothetical protein
VRVAAAAATRPGPTCGHTWKRERGGREHNGGRGRGVYRGPRGEREGKRHHKPYHRGQTGEEGGEGGGEGVRWGQPQCEVELLCVHAVRCTPKLRHNNHRSSVFVEYTTTGPAAGPSVPIIHILTTISVPPHFTPPHNTNVRA